MSKSIRISIHLLCFSLLLFICMAGGTECYAGERAGSSNGVSWTFYEDTGRLYIYGNGYIGSSFHDSPGAGYTTNIDSHVWWEEEESGDGYIENAQDVVRAVTVQQGVSIEAAAFLGYSNLEEVDLIEANKIGPRAFAYCQNLSKIEGLENVAEIYEAAFYDCEKLKSLSLLNVNSVEHEAFYGCTSLEEVDFGYREGTSNGVHLGVDAFCFCQIKELTIPGGSLINSTAFSGLRKMTILGNLQEPSMGPDDNNGSDTYYNRMLRCYEVIFEKDVTKVGRSLFARGGVGKITFKGPIESIEESAFFCANGLSELYLPKSIKYIGKSAFGKEDSSSYKYLEHLYYEGSEDDWKEVQIIDESDYSNFDFKTAIFHYNVSDPSFKDENSGKVGKKVYWEIENEVLRLYGEGKTNSEKSVNKLSERFFKELVVENGVTSLSYNLFEGCANLEKATIAESVECIESGAFTGCSNLSEVVLNEGLKEIEENAFEDCYSLDELHLPSTLESLKNMRVDLNKVNIPKNLTNIESDYFGWLNYVSVDEGNPVYDSRDNCNAVIETSTGTLVLGTTNTEIPRGVTRINDDAFGREIDKDWFIPDTVKYIGDGLPVHSLQVDDYHWRDPVIYYQGTEEQWKSVTIRQEPYYDIKVLSMDGKSMSEYKAPINNVIALIKKIGPDDEWKWTEEDIPAIERAKAAYDKLTQGQKKYFLKTGYNGENLQEYDYLCSAVEEMERIKRSKTIPKKITPTVLLSTKSYTYNGKVRTPSVTVKDGSKVLKKATDYTVSYSSGRKNAGEYNVKVVLKGNYSGSKVVSFKINKAVNTLKVGVKTGSVNYSKLKKSNQILQPGKVLTFKNKGQGKLSYKKVSGNKKITINATTGKVTVKKGLKKNTYKVKVKIKAAGNKNYKASAWKTVTFKVKVK